MKTKPKSKLTIAKDVEDIRAENVRFGLPENEDLTISLAWQRWARRQSGKTIGDVVMKVNAHFFTRPGELSALLDEAWFRLKSTKPRTKKGTR